MITIYFHSLFALIITLVFGSFLYNPKFKEENFISELSSVIIFGLILATFLGLLINFFFPLNKIVNTIIFSLFLVFFFIYKIKFFINKKIFFYLLVSSLIITLQLSYSNIFRPDAGMYHYPFIDILNNEKIIIGLANIHFRFGLTSIFQYTSAFFNNYILNNNGIVIPPAIISTTILIFFSNIVLKVKKKIDLQILFSLSVFIFITIKMNRYSEYGNDYLAHFLFFFIISKFLEEDHVKKKFIDLSTISLFAFLIKPTIFFILLFPIFLFRFKFIKTYLLSFRFYFIFLFAGLWLLKNLFITGCYIYPLSSTCINKVSWSANFNPTYNAKQVKDETESWSKGYPSQHKYKNNKIINHQEFISNFNWIKFWSKDHFLKICKIISSFLLILIIIFFIVMRIEKKEEKIINFNKLNKEKNKGLYIILILIISNIYWFLNYPLYRFGFSYLISFICIIWSIMLIKKFNLKNFKINKLVLSILILASTIFFLKQGVRIVKKYNNQNIAWPNFYLKETNSNQQFYTVPLVDIVIYKAENACMYGRSPCTHYDISTTLRSKKKFSYIILYYKK